MKPLRVLWITHDIFECFLPYVKGRPSRGGSWIAPLFYNIHKNDNVRLAAITPVVDGMEQKEVIEGVAYYSIPITKVGNTVKMSIHQVSMYMRAIKDFEPNIIHIHGTEKNFGLLRKYVDSNIPIVCSIQGMIIPYYYFLKYSVASTNIEKFRSLKNIIGYGGVKATLRKWKRYRNIEKEIYELNHYYIGRTFWDEAQLRALNSKAKYFHGEELLRSPFYSTSWNIEECERHRIFISSAAYPIKGFHIVLQALALLRKRFPDVKVVAPLSSIDTKSSRLKDYIKEEDYNNFLKSEIKKLNLDSNILFLSRLTAEEMAYQYTKAHVFVLPSFIENSPNSLGESMLTGTPAIVTPVGGVTSIIKDNESSLVFPTGDYAALAFQIERIFSDDELAKKISQNAKEVAMKRHDLEKTTKQYLTIYTDIIKLHHENITHTF